MIVLALTLGINTTLVLVLLFRDHWKRYSVLFWGSIWMVWQALLLRWVYITYGTSSILYFQMYRAGKMAAICWTFGIILEGFRWRNRCERVPQELYLLSLLFGYFLTKKAGLEQASHVIHEILRWGNMLATAFLIVCFKNPSPDERKHFYERR